MFNKTFFKWWTAFRFCLREVIQLATTALVLVRTAYSASILLSPCFCAVRSQLLLICKRLKISMMDSS